MIWHLVMTRAGNIEVIMVHGLHESHITPWLRHKNKSIFSRYVGLLKGYVMFCLLRLFRDNCLWQMMTDVTFDPFYSLRNTIEHMCTSALFTVITPHLMWKHHDDIMAWKPFPYQWPFGLRIQQSLVDLINIGPVILSFDGFFFVPWQTVKETVKSTIICDAIILISGHYNVNRTKHKQFLLQVLL